MKLNNAGKNGDADLLLKITGIVDNTASGQFKKNGDADLLLKITGIVDNTASGQFKRNGLRGRIRARKTRSLGN